MPTTRRDAKERPKPFVVGEPIPLMCKVSDVCRILQCSERRFYELLADQRIPFPEVKPRIGTPRFRGEDIQRYIDGGYDELPPRRRG